MTDNNKAKVGLILPSLRARMGDWTYYISFMKMKDLAERVSQAQLLYKSQTLQELLQRQVLPERARDIERYLRTQEQRFFNALVIGTYGGAPKWREVKVKQGPIADKIDLPSDLEGVLGFLSLDGTEKLFTIDGQHRVEGMRLAVKNQPSLGDEEVCVILIKGITGENRAKDPTGFERTRRLFTTLNRYAKPVNKKDIIALDEDDAVAIITRRLVEENPLFYSRKTSIKGATSIPVGDKQSFTSINALYDGLDLILRFKPKPEWKKFKRFYPTDREIEELYNRAVDLWDAYCKHFPPLKEIRDSRPDELVAEKYRNNRGGHALFRPIGLLISLRVVRNLKDHNQLSNEKAVERIARAPMDLAREPWAYLIWNPANKKIITAAQNQGAAEKLLFNALGGELSAMKSSTDELKKLLAAIQNKEVRDINLPSYGS